MLGMYTALAPQGKGRETENQSYESYSFKIDVYYFISITMLSSYSPHI